MDAKLNACPLAELVTASDCYPILYQEGSSEGREFEPHRGSSFLQIFFIVYHTCVKKTSSPPYPLLECQNPESYTSEIMAYFPIKT